MAKLNEKSDNFLSQVKLGESYTSLFLGVVVVAVALVLIFSFLKSRNLQNQQTTSTSTQNEQSLSGKHKNTYMVKTGDDLWHIAQSVYGSGYNWVDLAQANHLSNPSTIYVGTSLVVPNVKVRQPVTENSNLNVADKITGTSYTIQKGDDLWNIAIRAYGDGYKWLEIAKANNLSNPNLIHSGNVLRIPR